MKPNSITQSDYNLDFEGQGNKDKGVNRGASKSYCGNQYSGMQNPNKLITGKRGPTVGNKSDDDSTYPDAAVVPKFTPGKNMFMGSANPQVRESGGGRFPGTRPFMPSAEQNYKGNADMINFGRGPTKGNQR
jgi:hypothetical protein